MPMRPPIEELFTMAPLSCFRIWSSSYFMQRKILRRLIAFTRSNSSLVASAVSTAGLCPPAFVKPAPKPPHAETHCSTGQEVHTPELQSRRLTETSLSLHRE